MCSISARVCSGVVAVAAEGDDLGLGSHLPSLDRDPLLDFEDGCAFHACRRRAVLQHVPPRRAPVLVRRRPPALHAADPARERPPRGRRGRRAGGRDLGRPRRAFARDLVCAVARAAPGLHRRAGRRRPRRDAGRDRRPRRRPGADQPADPGRARDRPLGAGRRVRLALRLRAQRRARVRAQPRALRLPALGAALVPRLPGRAAREPASATR